MTTEDLISLVESIRNVMIAVATGGPRIQTVNDGYKQNYMELSKEFSERGLVLPKLFTDLWDWYGYWSNFLPTYQSRRKFVNELLDPIIASTKEGNIEALQPTGWPRVDRALLQVRETMAKAIYEEQFQAVGLLCREIMISLAQAVYIPERHPTIDGTPPSNTDVNRMLEAYIAAELAGPSNEEARRYARSAVALALALQHDRTASFRQSIMCSEATTSVVNFISILAGRRDPQ